jgi:hypothetical protein
MGMVDVRGDLGCGDPNAGRQSSSVAVLSTVVGAR